MKPLLAVNKSECNSKHLSQHSDSLESRKATVVNVVNPQRAAPGSSGSNIKKYFKILPVTEPCISGNGMECGILEQSTDAGCRGPQVVSFQAAHTNHTTLLPPPPPSGKKTLVLDLDATLIDTLHSNQEGRCDPDFIYTDSSGCRAKIWKRPHLLEFLQAVSKDFEVVLFTAAGQRHADAVLSHLDPNGTLIHHRLYGHHTVPCPQWSWVKDLSKLGRDLSQTLIVDDCEAAVLFQRDNWVSIPAFSHWNMDCKEERALLDILTFLQNKVLPAADVREALALHYNQVARKPFPDPEFLPTPSPRSGPPHVFSASPSLSSSQEEREHSFSAGRFSTSCSMEEVDNNNVIVEVQHIERQSNGLCAGLSDSHSVQSLSMKDSGQGSHDLGGLDLNLIPVARIAQLHMHDAKQSDVAVTTKAGDHFIHQATATGSAGDFAFRSADCDSKVPAAEDLPVKQRSLTRVSRMCSLMERSSAPEKDNQHLQVGGLQLDCSSLVMALSAPADNQLVVNQLENWPLLGVHVERSSGWEDA
ncbi:hypothetical protein CEUSTIGMA_g3100.t1 [Chlamydomonas eustigma]|uniref:Mitochondrial import inner membrane translocase subunit TIM50 n=1 Tax=Chlamydomonas eustigma TaxID=1157962 RepID=A0A250WXZ6_9CHLO|nr:hypothetical protein CEUSTIGMA_g3100.t1 [Chlamydomonas eustigma]|eukprot:GAX75656.1 hypothetical protein CEUSTIGMA_g3100.t1 [Chlamydomonas eustigma]